MAASTLLSPTTVVAPTNPTTNKRRNLQTIHILSSSKSLPSSSLAPPRHLPPTTPLFSHFPSPFPLSGLSSNTWRALPTPRSSRLPSPPPPPPSIGRGLLLSLPALAPLLLLACRGAAAATGAVAADSIRASRIGLRIAEALRGTGWPDEAIVFALASLPVLELRGAIPVGYWMHLDPLLLTALSVIGNMLPVPFILLYSKSLVTFLSERDHGSSYAAKLLEALLWRAREKAGPVKEFQWLGLMLFVAVPFPGTGAWTGAIVASVLDMPFWSVISANFVGVILAGLLVNLLVNLGLKYAIATGVMLFFMSTFMWSILRQLKTRPIS